MVYCTFYFFDYLLNVNYFKQNYNVIKCVTYSCKLKRFYWNTKAFRFNKLTDYNLVFSYLKNFAYFRIFLNYLQFLRNSNSGLVQNQLSPCVFRISVQSELEIVTYNENNMPPKDSYINTQFSRRYFPQL